VAKWSEMRAGKRETAKKRADIVYALQQICQHCEHHAVSDHETAMGEPYCDLVHKGGCRSCGHADTRPTLYLRLLHHGRCGQGKWDTLLEQAGAL